MAIDSTKSVQENYAKYAEYFEDSSNDLTDVNTFYSLLLAEMQNQDPLEPTSNTEFISQLASFQSLTTQNNSAYYQQANYATSLSGKTVTVATSTGTGLSVDTGVVTAVDLSDGTNFVITVNGKQYGIKSVMAVTPGETTSSVSGDGAYATSLIGKNVTVASTDTSGNTVIDQGTVDSVEVKDGKYTVIINGLAYDLSAVVRVANAAASGSNSDESAETDTADEVTPTDEATETTPTDTSDADSTEITGSAETEILVDEAEELLNLFS